jgi:putative MATE family efflux protein
MRKGLLSSYVAGLVDTVHGESYGRIIRYLTPEFITALLLTSMPFWVDGYFIAHLKSTATYATLGVTGNLIHFLIKSAEAFSVGTVILSGQFNGRGEYTQAGKVLRDSFWVTCLLGFLFALVLFLGADTLYRWYGVDYEMRMIGIPFLRLRAVSVFFTFTFLAFVGFLRGIKNSKVPMFFFMAGAVLFVVSDYVFIFGRWGFPAMGLQGSALASLVQYASMFFGIMIYVLCSKRTRRYGLHLFRGITTAQYVPHLFHLSWPIILDKTTIAFAYIWLSKLFCSMGTNAAASYCVVKDMERFSILPAIAGAQVITFLVSNDCGIQNWEGVKSNIKKMILLTAIVTIVVLSLFCYNPKVIIALFDRKGDFTDFAARVFPVISVLSLFDVLQLILAGALRGAGNVHTVMLVRLAITFGYFLPFSYFISTLPFQDPALKFILLYGSFYVGNALMILMYVAKFRSEDWKIPFLKRGL